ncbi:MAG: hypothetical protein VX223_01170, partial [Myxococcota bacterium]|nr:hypothetical protein [Myxococcota bacterium]
LRSDGSVSCWGLDTSGQLGNGGISATQVTPMKVALTGVASHVSTGDEHTCAIMAGGQTKCWGEGSFGRLGYGGSADQYLPQVVAPGPSLLWEAKQVAAAEKFSCAVRSNGSVSCWGDGATQLANVTSGATPQFSPLQNIVKIDAGQTHTCAIDTSSQLWCWGDNVYGQLGNGSNTTPDMPYLLPLTGVIDVSAGGSHTCAFADGGLYCWGANTSKQIGNPSATTLQTTPLLVPGF